MTQKLEELLNLPESKEIINKEKAEKAETAILDQKETKRDIAEFDKIASALPSVKRCPILALTAGRKFPFVEIKSCSFDKILF